MCVTQHDAFPVRFGIWIVGEPWKWQEPSRAVDHIKTIVGNLRASCRWVPVKVEDKAIAMNRVEITTARRIVLTHDGVHR